MLSRNSITFFLSALFTLSLIAPPLSTFGFQNAEEQPEQIQTSEIWISAYLASWNHYAPPGGNWGNMPTHAINWNAFTHMLYFAFQPKSDGSLSEVKKYENLNPDRLSEIVIAAHNHGKPILFTVGGWNTRDRFKSAYSDANRENFINTLIYTMKKWGFDGIDLDMEPIRDNDTAGFKKFVKELHAALQYERTPLLNRPLLTTATSWQPEMFAELQDKFDQINLMTYDLSGAWSGWVTWHNSPLYNGGHTFSNGNSLPSVNSKIDKFINAGIKPGKIGIGIDFYGYVWHGVSEPREGWSGKAPRVERPGGVPYYELAKRYNLSKAEWDNDAQVSFLSIKSPEQFVSFDNERSVRQKIDYLKRKKLGGAILWEISGGYQKDQPPSSRNKLLQAVEEELNQQKNPQ